MFLLYHRILVLFCISLLFQCRLGGVSHENTRGASAPRRTENGKQNARQARDEVRDRQLWSVYPAGLPQRTRRTTVQARSDKPSTAKGHKEHVAGGTADFGRTQSGTEDTEGHRDGRRASARRTRGGSAAPENRERSVQARRDKPSTATENRARGKRATGEAAEKAKPPSL